MYRLVLGILIATACMLAAGVASSNGLLAGSRGATDGIVSAGADIAAEFSLISTAYAQVPVPGQPAAATAAAPKRPGFFDTLSKMMPMIAMIFMIFFFFVIRPQTQKLKEQQTLVESLKKGEQVVTTSGIIGKVAGIEKGCILLELSPSTKVRFTPTSIEKRFDAKPEQKAAGDGA